MGLPEIVQFARKFSVMVKVQGPDPKGLKKRKHAFHQCNYGKTTLSASGMLLPQTLYDADMSKRIFGVDVCESVMLVVTVASVIEPFMSLQHRHGVSQGQPEFQIDVMLEEKLEVEKGRESTLDKGGSSWLSARLVRLVDVPTSSLAVQSLVEASSGSQKHGWEVGWSLDSHDNGHRRYVDDIQIQTEHGNRSSVENQRHLTIGESSNPSLIGKSTTRIAILGVFSCLEDVANIALSPSNRRRDFVFAVGSPFSVLSPVHFFNSISVGSISNCYPPRSANISLLMADIRCLPGMEGAPVFDEHAHFIGILIRPLRQKITGAEIQLVIPWEAIATACSDLLLKGPKNADKGIFCHMYGHLNFYCDSMLPVEKATSSVCLITIDESVWASGVLLNNQGLILTNAHLLEPWRFGKSTSNTGRNGTKYAEFYQQSQKLLPKTLEVVDSSVDDENKGYKMGLSSKVHRSIRVRLDHVNPWIWCDAKVVYICKGPLDIALLQLEYVPDQLHPINVDLVCPSLGSKAYIIGHGLFGPRCGFSPSICSGMVAKIVKAKVPQHYQSIEGGDSHIPAMLETTAAVNPGASGGAVVNSRGHMIGLVTSNARHGGGTVIPHLNFSIPCAVLTPIFEFAKDMQNILLLQNLDQPNEHTASVWALVLPLATKPTRPFPALPKSMAGDNNKEGKGSKFAKFIAERDKVLRGPPQLGKAESLSNVIVLSKL